MFGTQANKKGQTSLTFSKWGSIITLWVIAAFSIVILFLGRQYLGSFLIAGITAYIFNPLISFCASKTKVPRIWWILLLYILLGILLFLVIRGVFPLIKNEIIDLASGSPNQPNTFLGRLSSQGTIQLPGFTIDLKVQVSNFTEWLTNQVLNNTANVLYKVFDTFIHFIIFLMITFYLLLDMEKFIRQTIRIIPQPYRREVWQIGLQINRTLGAYIRGLVVLIIIMSVASFCALQALGVRYALVLSLATGILEAAPLLGPILATILAATVALFQPQVAYGLNNITLVIIVISIYFVLRQLEDYFIIPNVVGQFVHVHPALAIFALILGGHLGGAWGLFLAIPIAATLKVMVSYLYTKSIEGLKNP